MTSSAPDTRATRQAIIDACLWMNRRGINQGTSGNVSVRVGTRGDRMLITPTAVPYDMMTPEMLVEMPVTGEPAATGPRPSSEWRFHQALLAARPDMQAVVHAHSPHATAVACQRRPIEAIHYMVAVFGGADVPLTGYHLFGSEALARDVAATMAHRHGCLMASHGAVVVGETLDKALWRIEELEALAKMDLLCRAGPVPPVLLSGSEIAQVVQSFAAYRPGVPIPEG
ncbi:MAG: class II aldolase/adducin family protein [Rhodobacteraceae bacterium]|nr:class II aldolase/adducin family protein [Paracoccaceae bacterium]